MSSLILVTYGRLYFRPFINIAVLLLLRNLQGEVTLRSNTRSVQVPSQCLPL